MKTHAARPRRDLKGLIRAGRAHRLDGIVAAITFVLGMTIAAALFYLNPYLQPFETYNFVNIALLLWLPLAAILLFLRIGPEHFGMQAGDRRFGLKFTLIAILVMLPIIFAAGQLEAFREQYSGRLSQPLASIVGRACTPFYSHALTGNRIAFTLHLQPHPLGLLYYELGMGCYFFCWEFFFRGFLLFGLARARLLGNFGAIVVQAIPFTLLHWSVVPQAAKPMPEIVSAFFGGLALGWLAVRTRSFFYGFLIHWAIAGMLDLFVILPQLLKL